MLWILALGREDYRVITTFQVKFLNLTIGSEDAWQDLQQITELGRSLSAAFTALATVLLALLGFSVFRYAGFIVIAVLLLLNPHLYEFGHFFKEDGALLFGVGATLAALAFAEHKPNYRRFAIVGLATGLAVSAKYIGVLTLLAALLSIIAAAGPGNVSFARKLAFAGVVLVVALPSLA